MSKTVLTTLVVTDLVGSTDLVRQMGDHPFAALMERLDRTIRRLLQEHNGTEIDKTDGFLLLFDQTLDAVRFSAAMHRALGELSTDVALKMRVGIHVGDVVVRHNAPEDVARGAKPIEVEGLAKPVAARVMSMADGRQTLLTRTAWDLVKRASIGTDIEDWKFIEHGLHNAKGLEEPIEIFEVGPADLTPGTKPATSARAGAVKNRRTGLMLLGLGAFLAAAVAIFALSGPTTRVTVWSGLDDVFGVPVGAGVRDPPAVPFIYRFEVTEVDGRVVAARAIDHAGKTQQIPWLYRDIGAVTVEYEDGEPRRVRWFDKVGTLAAVEHLERDGDQLLRHYRNADGTIAESPDGLHLPRRDTLDSNGRWFRRELLNHDDSTKGILAREFNDNGAPVLLRQLPGYRGFMGWTEHRSHYDDPRWPRSYTGWDQRGPGGVSVPDKEGCFGIAWELDDARRPVRQTCLDADGAPRERAEGADAGCATVTLEFDGLHLTTRCLDPAGKVVDSRGGWRTHRSKLGTHDNVEELAFLGPEGQLHPNQSGVARIEMDYDDRGRWVATRYFGAAGERVHHPQAGWGDRRAYDDTSFATEITHIGPDGQPTTGPDGCATTQRARDAHGNLVGTACFDAAGAATPDVDGVHQRVHTLGEVGLVVRTDYLSVDGGPAISASVGAASQTWEFGADAGLKTRTFLDEAGEPTLARVPGAAGPVLCASLILDWSKKTNFRRKTCAGVDGEPRQTAEGWAIREDTFGPFGRNLQNAFLDAEGKPTLTTLGYARKETRHNDRWMRKSEAYFGPNDEPVLDALDGCAQNVRSHDEDGMINGFTCIGTDGERPVANRRTGCARATQIRDASGDLIERACFDAGDNPAYFTAEFGFAHRVRIERDDAGRIVATASFDVDGQPFVAPDGTTRVTYAYDSAGNQVRMDFFGPDGERVALEDGTATELQEYNAAGQRIRHRSLDASGASVAPIGKGFAEERRTFDAVGNNIRSTFVGADGQPGDRDGRTERIQRFDHRQNRISERQLGVNGTPMAFSDGCMEHRWSWDPAGRELSRTCFDQLGAAMSDVGGVHAHRTGRDARGRVVERSTHDTSDAPVVPKGGWFAAERTTWGAGNWTVEVSWFGADSEPIAAPGGWDRQVFVRDGIGRWTEQRWEGSGRLVDGPEGFARAVRVWSADGAGVEETWYDLAGNLVAR